MTDHDPYEVLCTLAATGQLTAAEEASFDAHRLHCAACREQFQDFLCLGAQLQMHAVMHATFTPMPRGSVERFRVRAIREGVATRYFPVRPSPWYALCSAVAALVVVAAVVFLPHGRKAAEGSAISTPAPISARQSLVVSVTGRTPVRQPTRAVQAHIVRHEFVLPAGAGLNDASFTAAQRFPQVITASYPFLGLQSRTKSSSTLYPALSPSLIARLDLFPSLDDLQNRNPAATAASDHSIDIASGGGVFDFAANLRQLRFQVPTAQ